MIMEKKPDHGSRITAVSLLVSRILVGGILLYSGFSKALAPAAEFAAQIELYKLLPHVLLTPFAIGLPWLEIWVGLFTLCGLHTRKAALTAAGLFVMFIGAIGLAFARGIDLKDCGCFGAGSLPPHITLIMDIVMISLCLFIAWKSQTPQPYTLDKKLTR